MVTIGSSLPGMFDSTHAPMFLPRGESDATDSMDNPDQVYPVATVFVANHSAFTREHYSKRIEQFKKSPVAADDIVFLGNSLIEQGGDWSERLNFSTIHNRGISGDVTDGVLQRLGEIAAFKPLAVFLLIGINDLCNSTITAGYVSSNIIQIARQIRLQSPETNVFIQTILPTCNLQLKDKIRKANQLLLAAEAISNVTVLDTHTYFATADGLLDPNFTEDGLHLTEMGYRYWTAMLRIYVDRLR